MTSEVSEHAEVSTEAKRASAEKHVVESPVTTAPVKHHRKWFLLAATAVAVVVTCYLLAPMVKTALNTVSTDDAYVNGHVTFVAPRVSGQVAKVLVDDNQRVNKGDLSHPPSLGARSRAALRSQFRVRRERPIRQRRREFGALSGDKKTAGWSTGGSLLAVLKSEAPRTQP